MRQPLKDRVNGTWTEFEAQLFNLVTRGITDEEIGDLHFLFSARLDLTQRLLDTVDRFLEERGREEVVQ